MLGEERAGKKEKREQAPALPNAVIYTNKCSTNERIVKSDFPV